MTSPELLQFLTDPAWDAPFFKKLAANDTGNAPGHQGGVVIPIELRQFFPELNEDLTSSLAPTTDRNLIAEMYLIGDFVASDLVRYQIQTWGGKRRAESRITGQLGPIRNLAYGGDILIVQRSRESLESFRFVLVRQTDPAFLGIDAATGDRRWGALDAAHLPITQQELADARVTMVAETKRNFVPIQLQIYRKNIARAAIARDTAFRHILLGQYQQRCAVSGIGLVMQSAVEAQAAHVIPLGRGGPDEPRNGLLLTGTLHWAFDRGLFGVDPERRIIVPRSVQMLPANEWLRQYDGRSINEAIVENFRTADAAFEWHRRNLVAQWL